MASPEPNGRWAARDNASCDGAGGGRDHDQPASVEAFAFVADERNEPLYNTRMVRAEQIQRVRSARGRGFTPLLACGPPGLHRQDRGDRLLHGRRVRPAARSRSRLCGLERQLRDGPKDAETFLAGACPIVGSYGAKDWTLRGAADRLERALTADGIEHDIKEYPGAGHAFLNDHRDPLSRAMRVVNIGYHQPSANDARRRIISLFDDHLKSHEPAGT